jgi:NADH-quinone oxidoreductase subunit E
MNAVESVLKMYPRAGRDALIPILQQVQDVQGYLSREAVTCISRHLRLPAAKIYGVATFYNQFRFQPKGKYHVMVCRGTACHVKGSNRVLETAQNLLKLKPGQTSRDRLFSLGACGLSPVVNLNGEFFAKVTPQKLSRIIHECREKESKNGH